MVVALYVVAVAMVLGGVTFLVRGAPFSDLLWGSTMVVAGSVAASAGVVLAGLAAVVDRLRRLEGDVAAVAHAEPVTASSAGTISDSTAGGRPSLFDAVLPSDGAPVIVPEPSATGHGPDAPAPTGGQPQSPAEVTPALLAPEEPGIAGRGGADPEGYAEAPDRARSGASVPSGGILGAAGRGFRTLREQRGGPPSSPVPDPAGGVEDPGPPASESATAAADRLVIGTYSSGGNSYVMFSDGSIDAETPRGNYRFQSLGELKEFIASGGERAASEPA